jgi:hypothetical protein
MNNFFEEDENVEDIKKVFESSPSGLTKEPTAFENSVKCVTRSAELNDLDYVVVWVKQSGNDTLRFVESYKRYTNMFLQSKFWKSLGYSKEHTVYTGPL